MFSLKRLADFVSELRQRKNLSTHEVARLSGSRISHSAVWSIENNRGNDVGIRTLEAIAKGLGIGFEELLLVGLGNKSIAEIQMQDHYAASILEKFSQLTPAEKQQLMPYLKVLEREMNELPKPSQKKKAS